MSLFTLDNKTILVTGAGSGIGQATACLCAEMGASLILVGRDIERLSKTKSMLVGKDKHIMVSLDINDSAAFSECMSDISVIDGVAACAGIASMQPFNFISQDDMQKVFQTNFFGQISLMQYLLKKKKLNKPASIVFVSSVDGNLKVHAGNSVYSASKSALVGMARSMAVELAAKKIRVNCVLPGTTDTPMIRTANVTEEELQNTALQTPFRRFAESREIAAAIAFLLTDAASYISGTELVVDGASHLV